MFYSRRWGWWQVWFWQRDNRWILAGNHGHWGDRALRWVSFVFHGTRFADFSTSGMILMVLLPNPSSEVNPHPSHGSTHHGNHPSPLAQTPNPTPDDSPNYEVLCHTVCDLVLPKFSSVQFFSLFENWELNQQLLRASLNRKVQWSLCGGDPGHVLVCQTIQTCQHKSKIQVQCVYLACSAGNCILHIF